MVLIMIKDDYWHFMALCCPYTVANVNGQPSVTWAVTGLGSD